MTDETSPSRDARLSHTYQLNGLDDVIAVSQHDVTTLTVTIGSNIALYDDPLGQ